MSELAKTDPRICHCLAMRQASRHITQLYDHHLQPIGLRTTQYSILRKLARAGSLTVAELAAELVVDRTTLTRNLAPLERDGLLTIQRGATDRRRKELRLTRLGQNRLVRAERAWEGAQLAFEASFGKARSDGLRTMLGQVAALPFAGVAHDD